MPNPRTGTVSTDLARVIKEVRAGRVDFRVEKANLIHAPIGKLSFTEEQLRQNIGAFIDAIVKAKPTGAKGQYIKAIYLSSTMGPGIQLELQSALALPAA
jgi:large subunit ribosomal protein L1